MALSPHLLQPLHGHNQGSGQLLAISCPFVFCPYSSGWHVCDMTLVLGEGSMCLVLEREVVIGEPRLWGFGPSEQSGEGREGKLHVPCAQLKALLLFREQVFRIACSLVAFIAFSTR